MLSPRRSLFDQSKPCPDLLFWAPLQRPFQAGFTPQVALNLSQAYMQYMIRHGENGHETKRQFIYNVNNVTRVGEMLKLQELLLNSVLCTHAKDTLQVLHMQRLLFILGHVKFVHHGLYRRFEKYEERQVSFWILMWPLTCFLFWISRICSSTVPLIMNRVTMTCEKNDVSKAIVFFLKEKVQVAYIIQLSQAMYTIDSLCFHCKVPPGILWKGQVRMRKKNRDQEKSYHHHRTACTGKIQTDATCP